MGLKAIPMSADTGPIGGDLSHEVIILAETGESKIFADKNIFEIDPTNMNLTITLFKKCEKILQKFMLSLMKSKQEDLTNMLKKKIK